MDDLKYFQNNELEPNKEPHVVRGPFDTFAFNTLAVQELIVAMHAGNKKVWVKQEDFGLVVGSSPGKRLISLGWEFLIMKP